MLIIIIIIIIIVYQKWQVKVGYTYTVVFRTVSNSGFLWAS